MSNIITLTQSSNIHFLTHILGTCAWIFSSCARFTVNTNRVMKLHPTPLQVIIHQSVRGRSESTQYHAKIAAINWIIYICTTSLHSFLSFGHCCAASTDIPLLPKATFRRSIQPNLGLLRTTPHLLPPSTPFQPYGTHPFSPRDQNIGAMRVSPFGASVKTSCRASVSCCVVMTSSPS